MDVISYQKQIIGHQIQAGVFDFLGQTFFDASAGESAANSGKNPTKVWKENVTTGVYMSHPRAYSDACR